MKSLNRTNSFILIAAFWIGLSRAEAAELITNGSFESSDFTGWQVINQADSFGTIYNITGAVTPENGFVTVGAADGTHYAVTDQGGPGAHLLLQSFTVAPGASTELSFEMFVNDLLGQGAVINPAGLDYTAEPNQHARVDILSNGADPFDTGSGVLMNLYLGVDPGPNPHSYTPYSFDLSSQLAAGGTFQLRFAEVDNQYYLNLGVDNVSIVSRGGSTQLPDGGSSGLCLGIGLWSVLPLRRWRRD